MKERSNFSSSATGMPTISSEAMLADACEIAQPWPSKRIDATRSSSPTFSITLSWSPQSGLWSSAVRSGASIGPQLWGRL